jgi:hypothetical protein
VALTLVGVISCRAQCTHMTEHEIAKRYDVNRVEPNSILRVVLIEEAVREYLKAEPGTLMFSLGQLCDAIDRDEGANVEA